MRSSMLFLVLAAAVGAVAWFESKTKSSSSAPIKRRQYREEEVDESLDESFPASDAPSWSSNAGDRGLPH